MEYIRAPKKNNGTTFSSKLEKGTDEENLILFKGDHSFVCMNLYPYNNGHLLLVPYEIVDKPEDLNKEAMNEIMKISTMSMKILRENMNAEGFNFGANLGKASGAGIEEHLHYHIVPRWHGDTNFMPVVGHTKVMVEGLKETWDNLKLHFDKLKESTDA